MDRQLQSLLIRLPPRVRPSVGSYEPRVQKVLKKLEEVLLMVEEQRREATLLVDRLLHKHLPEKRIDAIIRSKKLHSGAVAHEFIRRSLEIVFSDPTQAIELGRLGATSAIRILSTTPGAGDLCALAFAAAGNGCRVLRHYDKANHFFDTAYGYLGKQGAGDPYAQAQVFSLHASLLKDQGHFQEGLKVLQQSIELFQAEGDEKHLARCLINRGCILQLAKDPDRAIQAYLDTLTILDGYEDPFLAYVAAVNLASIYCDIGDFTAAQSALKTVSEEAMEDIVKSRGTSPQLQFLWTDARVAAGLRKRTHALRLLRQVETGFRSLADPVNTILVALDRARLLHQMYKHDEVFGILEQVHRVLHHHPFPERLREMVSGLVAAARKESLMLQSLEEMISRLREHRAQKPC